jgi:hypothetical protein
VRLVADAGENAWVMACGGVATKLTGVAGTFEVVVDGCHGSPARRRHLRISDEDAKSAARSVLASCCAGTTVRLRSCHARQGPLNV